MRILIVTRAPLSLEFGAGQVAVNLAKALSDAGHEVKIWSSSEQTKEPRWWMVLRAARKELEQFISAQDRFDFIELPAMLASVKSAQSSKVIVRSVQPELLYLKEELNYPPIRTLNAHSIARKLAVYLYSVYPLFLTVNGWRCANRIFCLGARELDWMNSRFPFWRHKLSSYRNAPSTTEQVVLREISRNRAKVRKLDSVRFLWIGRWHPQKGTDELLSFIEQRNAIYPQDRFTIAGCGHKVESDIPRRLLDSGIVTLIKSFERTQLYDLLRSHDAGLLTSRVEGWGLVLNEMLESGMPVFATPVGATLELKRYFPNSLHSFPPIKPVIVCEEDERALNDYYSEFNWSRIADLYLSDLGCVSTQVVRSDDS